MKRAPRAARQPAPAGPRNTDPFADLIRVSLKDGHPKPADPGPSPGQPSAGGLK